MADFFDSLFDDFYGDFFGYEVTTASGCDLTEVLAALSGLDIKLDSITASIGLLPSVADIRYEVERMNGVRDWGVYNDSPLFEPSGIDNGTATWPKVISINSSTHHMYYSAIDESGKYCINHRLLTGSGRVAGSPTRIMVGDQTYDQAGLFLPVAANEGSTIHMFYCGMPSLFANQQICYATATTGDPTNFTKQGVAIPYSGLPSYLHGGAEPTSLIKVGSTYYLYMCSVKGTQSPSYGTYISNQDRRAAVAVSDNLTDWEIYPLLCNTGTESAQEPWLYAISAEVFRAGTSSTSLFYLLACGGGINTDYQQIELFESPSPLFPKGYYRHIDTILVPRDTAGNFPDTEIDVLSIMTNNINRNSFSNASGEIRLYFGGKNYGENWKIGLSTQSNITQGLRPAIQNAAHRLSTQLSSNLIEIQERTLPSGEYNYLDRLTELTVNGSGLTYKYNSIVGDSSNPAITLAGGTSSVRSSLINSAGNGAIVLSSGEHAIDTDIILSSVGPAVYSNGNGRVSINTNYISANTMITPQTISNGAVTIRGGMARLSTAVLGNGSAEYDAAIFDMHINSPSLVEFDQLGNSGSCIKFYNCVFDLDNPIKCSEGRIQLHNCRIKDGIDFTGSGLYVDHNTSWFGPMVGTPQYLDSQHTSLYNTVNSGVLVSSVSSGAVEDIFSTYTISQSYASDGAEGTPAQIMYLTQQAFTDFGIVGTTITVRQLDGSTTAATYLMNNSGTPTSRTRSS